MKYIGEVYVKYIGEVYVKYISEVYWGSLLVKYILGIGVGEVYFGDWGVGNDDCKKDWRLGIGH